MQPAAVSVLKPLHGAEPGLYENLRSFVEQDYLAVQPAVQIVLGVNHPEDGALEAARDLIRDFPAADIALVVDRAHPRQQPEGRRTSKTCWRRRVMTSWCSPTATCGSIGAISRRSPHRSAMRASGSSPASTKACSTGGLWSDLGALQINFGFLPNALLGDAVGVGGGCFGATIALRRATLRRIGGFARVRDELADDQRIGDAVRAQGLAVVLSPYLVEARVWEPSLAALWRHELRWARTVRGITPIGFAGSVATHPLAIALLAAGIAGFGSTAGVLLAATCSLRWAAATVMARAVGLPMRRLWLLPLRDPLSFAVFVASFFGRRVSWRDQNLHVEPNGRMTVVDGEKAL